MEEMPSIGAQGTDSAKPLPPTEEKQTGTMEVGNSKKDFHIVTVTVEKHSRIEYLAAEGQLPVPKTTTESPSSDPKKADNAVANGAYDLAVSASRIQQCVREGNAARFLHVAMPAYGPSIALTRKVSGPNGNSLTCEEAKKKITDARLMDHFALFEYNSLPTISKFIQHVHKVADNYLQAHSGEAFEEAMRKTILEAFHTNVSDSSDEAEKEKSGTCTSISRAGMELLNSIGLRSQYVVARTPFMTPEHAAVIVPCMDGVVLLELLGREAFVLRPEEETIHPRGLFTTKFKIVRTEEEYHCKSPVIVREMTFFDHAGNITGQSQVQYLLRPIANPDNPVMNHYMMEHRRYSVIGVTSTEMEGLTKSEIGLEVIVDFARGVITLCRKKTEEQMWEGGKAEDTQPLEVDIPFRVFNSKMNTVDLTLEDEATRGELAKKIRSFMASLPPPRESSVVEEQIPGTPPAGASSDVAQGEVNVPDIANAVDAFWGKFQAPAQIKNQVFELATMENLQIMQELYKQTTPKTEKNPPTV